MNNIYKVEGTLNQGFVGQISYTICLDKPYDEMAIDFSFNKQYHDVVTDDLKQFLVQEADGKYNVDQASDEDLTNAVKQMKTELQMVVTMNDTFIGGIHRQSNPKHLYFGKDEATPGCIPQESIHGVIKITIVAFSVIKDDTNYTLSLSAL